MRWVLVRLVKAIVSRPQERVVWLWFDWAYSNYFVIWYYAGYTQRPFRVLTTSSLLRPLSNYRILRSAACRCNLQRPHLQTYWATGCGELLINHPSEKRIKLQVLHLNPPIPKFKHLYVCPCFRQGTPLLLSPRFSRRSWLALANDNANRLAA